MLRVNAAPRQKPAIHTPDGYEADKETDQTKLPRCEYFTRYPNTSLFKGDVERVHHYSRSEDARHHVESQESDEIKFTPYPLTLRNRDKARARLINDLASANPPVQLPADSGKIAISTPTTGDSKDFVVILKLVSIPKRYFNILKLNNLPRHPEQTTFGQLLDAIKPVKKETITAISAHTGGFANPYHLQKYATNIKTNHFDTTKFPTTTIIYNELLEYKKTMCKYIEVEYARKMGQDKGKVNFSNDYPCILVRFNYRTDDKSATPDELKKTFFKRYNYMLMAYFIAIVDYHAFKSGIEIEMVARSSFGHNNPTIDVTNKSFRINIGLVPKAYADIIVDSLIKLYNLFALLESTATIHLVMNPHLRARLNLGRSGGKFQEPELPYTYWQSLWAKGSQGNNGIKMIGELVGREGGYRSDLLANFVLNAIIENPVEFFNTPRLAEAPLGKLFEYVEYGSTSKVLQLSKTIYENQGIRFKQHNPIFYDGISSKFYIYKRVKVDNKLQDSIVELRFNPTTTSLQKNDLISEVLKNNPIHHEQLALLFTDFKKDDEGSMSASEMREALAIWPNTNHRHWLELRQISGMKIESDGPLCETIKKLCTALCVDFPVGIEIKFLYKFLERANLEFMQNVRTREYNDFALVLGENSAVVKVPCNEWGSDSEIEPERLENAKPVYSKKVIVANGMLALNLAYYAAKVAWSCINAFDQNHTWQQKVFDNNMNTKFTVDIENTYFELEDCLDAAINPPDIVSGAQQTAQILFFDLNSFNADFIEQHVDLTAKLNQRKPQVVVLDHTSTTTDKIREAIYEILNDHTDVYLILLVSSGLKNEQGGADNNPYGRMTIVTRDNNKNLRDFVYGSIISLRVNGLSDKALLPPQAHMIRHSYKDRRIAPRSRDFFATPAPKMTGLTTAKQENTNDLPQEQPASSAQQNSMFEKFAQMSVNVNSGASKPTDPIKSKQSEKDYNILAEKYETSFNPGTGWRQKYISGEGGVSGVRSIFVAVFSDERYATCHSSEIRGELVAKIRDKLLLTHNGMTPQQKTIEIGWRDKIYGFLIADFIKSLAEINKSDRQKLLQSFLHLFHSNMSQRDHGAIETLIHRDIIKIDDSNIKYLLENYFKIVADPQSKAQFNNNVMEFCMNYLECIQGRTLVEGEDILQILAIILKVKVVILQENSKNILSATKDLPDTEYPNIYLDHVNDSLVDQVGTLYHYNVLLKAQK